MGTLKEQIAKDHLEAFKAGEKIKKNILGVIKSDITIQEKAANTASGEALSDEDVMSVLRKNAKKISDLIPFTKDDASLEELKQELAVVEGYFPKQFTEDEIKTEVDIIIEALGLKSPSDMGKVMKSFSAKFPGKADNKLLSPVVKDALSKSQ